MHSALSSLVGDTQIRMALQAAKKMLDLVMCTPGLLYAVCFRALMGRGSAHGIWPRIFFATCVVGS